MYKRSDAGTVSGPKLRSSQKIVNTRFDLKVLGNDCASRRASVKRAAIAVVIEVGREVAFETDVFSEIPNYGGLKSSRAGVTVSDTGSAEFNVL
jgi:shikimate kinase